MTKILLLPNNEHLAIDGVNPIIKIWDIKTRVELKQLKGHKNLVEALAWIEEELLASGSHDTSIKIWNLTDTRFLKNLIGHNDLSMIWPL